MKYIVILGDGMADYPIEELGGKTPLQIAKKPNMDFIAQHGMTGLVKTIPDGLKPGSDTANLSVLGYDPKVYYSGRSPLEAVSMGITLNDNDVTYRCNLVNLSAEDNFYESTMIDYSSDEITTEESKVLIDYLNKNLKCEGFNLYAGISYRHCLVLRDAATGADLTPPHDISKKKIKEYLPKGQNSELLLDLMKRSYKLLKDHPINKAREERGLKAANSMWFWGEGTKPKLPPFSEKFKLRGAVVSAVDLIKGIGICAGMKSIDVEGATGTINTNFSGKAKAVIDILNEGYDFVYVHIEAPDECGHRNELNEKIKAISLIDEKIIGPIIKSLNDKKEDYAIMVLPDHPTPLSINTHTSDPVPFAIYKSSKKLNGAADAYDEKSAAKTGIFIDPGHKLLDFFFNC
ncbi:MAG: cofactor-independent phosphoglycerate mutase [Eubacteriales bacterium]